MKASRRSFFGMLASAPLAIKAAISEKAPIIRLRQGDTFAFSSRHKINPPGLGDYAVKGIVADVPAPLVMAGIGKQLRDDEP